MTVQHEFQSAPSGGAGRKARITARLPLVLGWTRHYSSRGRVVDVDHVWTTANRWARLDEHDQADWTVERIGPFVLAERVRT